jgi:hypothetical protein
LVIVTSLLWWWVSEEQLLQLHCCSLCGPPINRNLDKEKSKHVGLAQQNGFGPSKRKLNEGNSKSMPLWFIQQNGFCSAFFHMMC